MFISIGQNKLTVRSQDAARPCSESYRFRFPTAYTTGTWSGAGKYECIDRGPAWRGVPGAAASALQAAKDVSDAAIEAAEKASLAAQGTPGAPAAKAAEETAKATAAASMGSAIGAAAAAAGADKHICSTPFPVPPHGPGVVIDGSATVMINNAPACRMGDTVLEAVGPPNKIMMGCMKLIIGG